MQAPTASRTTAAAASTAVLYCSNSAADVLRLVSLALEQQVLTERSRPVEGLGALASAQEGQDLDDPGLAAGEGQGPVLRLGVEPVFRILRVPVAELGRPGTLLEVRSCPTIRAPGESLWHKHFLC